MHNESECDLLNNSSNCSLGPPLMENSLFIPIFSILLIIVMFIGVMGNLLVIYVVLNYGRLKTVTNTYLLHLALSDLVFLSGIPFFLSSLITRAWIFGRFVCKLFFLTQGVNQYTSIIILALLAFDRYLAVCYSAKSIIWRTRVNPNLLLILTWLLSFILMLPIITSTTTQSSNSSEVQCVIDLPFPQSRSLYYIVLTYTATITFFLPISLMTYFYIRIVDRLKQNVSQQHRRSRTSMRTRRKVSVLVLTVISVHIFCCSPYWAFQVVNTSGLLPRNRSILLPLSSITQFLLFVNSSTNPILYAFLSEIFRLSFKRVFYCCVSADSAPFLNDKSLAKRNLTSTSNKTTYLQMKKQKAPLNNPTFENHQLQSSVNRQDSTVLTKQLNLNLNHNQARHSSLIPSASIFTSEASFASDT